jgi:hypothetical protein
MSRRARGVSWQRSNAAGVENSRRSSATLSGLLLYAVVQHGESIGAVGSEVEDVSLYIASTLELGHAAADARHRRDDSISDSTNAH